MSTANLVTSRSEELHKQALRVLPGGVTGAGRYSEPFPIAFRRAQGKWLYDVDDNAYVDLHGGFGTAILGYAHPEVDAAVIEAIREVGAFVGVPHPYEERLAERLCRRPACSRSGCPVRWGRHRCCLPLRTPRPGRDGARQDP